MMILKNNEMPQRAMTGDVSVKKFKDICVAIEEFAEKNYPDYQVGFSEMNSDSSALKGTGDRTDIWLIAIKLEGNVITDSIQQKVFFINGKLLTCKQYRTYLKKEGVL